MRIFLFTLSLYILTLSLIPCADALVIMNTVDNIELSNVNNSCDHSDHSDDCTPFCTCICCGSVIAGPSSQSLASPSEVFISSYLLPYDFDYSFDYTDGVWHPPTTLLS